MPRTSSIDAWQSSAEILPQEVRGAAGTVGPADGPVVSVGSAVIVDADSGDGAGVVGGTGGRLVQAPIRPTTSPSAATRHGRRLTT